MLVKGNKYVVLLMFALLFALLLAGCGQVDKTPQNGTSGSGSNTSAPDAGAADGAEAPPAAASDALPIVTMEMEDGGIVTIELYPEVAPNTVHNFISLVEQGFYDGVIFHRVIPGFMIQGGDPEGTGMGGPGYSIRGEFASNGFDNTLIHERGVLSMARSGQPDSAGSQFFIMVESAPHLDGQYAAFGKVIEGMEVVDRVVGQQRGANDRPTADQRIASMTVDTRGVQYPEPEKLP